MPRKPVRPRRTRSTAPPAVAAPRSARRQLPSGRSTAATPALPHGAPVGLDVAVTLNLDLILPDAARAGSPPCCRRARGRLPPGTAGSSRGRGACFCPRAGARLRPVRSTVATARPGGTIPGRSRARCADCPDAREGQGACLRRSARPGHGGDGRAVTAPPPAPCGQLPRMPGRRRPCSRAQSSAMP